MTYEQKWMSLLAIQYVFDLISALRFFFSNYNVSLPLPSLKKKKIIITNYSRYLLDLSYVCFR